MAAANNALVAKLVCIVLGMFGFGFALVPLYDVFCDLTGINGKTNREAAVYRTQDVDSNRTVRVEFITRVNAGMSWQFEPVSPSVTVHPGELTRVEFKVHNPQAEGVWGQAVPSVSPGTAALYLNKTECFCFEQQHLLAGESLTMPMQFYVDPQLPEDIHFLTLQYTLYKVAGDTAATNLERRF